MRNGVELIALERKRQVEKKGWSLEHDLEHEQGELAWAAVCYAAPAPVTTAVNVPDGCGCREAGCGCSIFAFETVQADPWPWLEDSDKRDATPRIWQLVKAGALIAAEIDRLCGRSAT